jgi:Tol biopolymer transport system component
MKKMLFSFVLVITFLFQALCFGEISIEVSPEIILLLIESSSLDTVDFTILNGEAFVISLDLSLESADSTFLVYADECDSTTFNGNIWKMRPDGSDATQITSDTLDFEPIWSPDGTKIVFYSVRSGNNDVWVMDSDGGNMTNLTNDPASDMNPSWSPDGQQIIFFSDRDDSHGEIYQMNSSGANVTRLTNNTFKDLRPKYSPDGLHFVTQSKPPGNQYDILVYTADGSSYQNLGVAGVGADYQPSWHPDGQRVIWVSGDSYVGGLDVVSAHIDGSDLETIISLPQNMYIPAYSPDAQLIAFDLATEQILGGDEIFIWNSILDTVSIISDSTISSKKWGPNWSPFINPPAWLSASTSSVNIAAGDSANVELYIDFTGFQQGLYSASAIVEDDSGNFLKAVHMLVLYGFPVDVDEEQLDNNSLQMYAYPNPLNNNASISFSLKETEIIHLSIYNLKGQLIRTIVDERLGVGNHVYSWNGKDQDGNEVKNGIYLYKISGSKGEHYIKKAVLIQ